jgi:hypothetical protein
MKTCLSMARDGDILYRKLLPSRPPHYGVKNLDALFVGERDGSLHREATEGTKGERHGGLAGSKL